MECHKTSGTRQIRVERVFSFLRECAIASITVRMYVMDVNLMVLLMVHEESV